MTHYRLPALAFASVTFFALSGAPALAEDNRQLATLPAAAQATLKQEMLDNLLAINDIIAMLGEGKVKEAGLLAEEKLGESAMGRNRALPIDARPGVHMPKAMHDLGILGHKAATTFAKAASTGDRDKALAALPGITGTCVACHYSYRTR